jgi:hypothetical protein
LSQRHEFNTMDQLQSFLFRLPRELRDEIYGTQCPLYNCV